MPFLSLSLAAHVQHAHGSQLCKPARSRSCGHGDEGIVSPAARYRIKLVFPALEPLLHLLDHIGIGYFFRLFPRHAHFHIFLQISVIGLLRVRLQNQIHAGHGESAVLLACRAQNDIPDHVKGHVQGLGLVVPDVSHLKAAGKHMLHVEQTAVHGIPSRGHVMHVDITVPAGLDLLRGHKKLLIQFLVQLIEDQASLGGNQSGIRIGILLIPDVHDGLALLVHVVQHPHEVLLVVAVIPVALRHDGLHLLQRALHHVMHHRDRDLVAFQLIHLLDHIAADLPVFLVRKPGQGAVGALSHRIDDLLDIEHFLRSVLLDHLYIPLRSVLPPVIRFLFPAKLFYRIFHPAFSPSVSSCSFPSDRLLRPPSPVCQARHSA